MSTNKTTSQIQVPPVAEWKFGEILHIKEGNKRYIPISYNGNDLVLFLSQCFAPFAISQYDTKDKRTLVSQLQPEWSGALDCMTDCLIHEVSEKSELFFGRVLDQDTLRAMYKNLVRQDDAFKYPSTLSAKVQLSGCNKTRFWDEKKARIETPIEFQGMHYNAIVHIKGIYIQENSWGLFANITDCQVFTSNVNCPF